MSLRAPKVLIVGAGRMGGALSRALVQAKWPVAVLRRSGTFSRARASALASAELCVFAVPDPLVAESLAALLPSLPPRAAVIHCAGAWPLSILKAWPGPRGSFHPLLAISSPRDALGGHAVAVAATDARLLKILHRMGRALGLFPIAIPESKRPLYHAGAVLGAGCLVGLVGSALEAFRGAGMNRKAAVSALIPLMESTLRGVVKRDLPAALTGPIARGDAVTLSRNLAVLAPDLRQVYRALSLCALKAAKGRVRPKARAELLRALR